MSFAVVSVALCDSYVAIGENGTNGCHLAVFSLDVAFACHFMATHLPPTFPLYRSTTGIGYGSKKLLS